MANQDLAQLDKLDLSQLTVADIRELKNDSLKKTLMESVERSTDVNSHQNHGSHSNHSTSPKVEEPVDRLPVGDQ